MDQNENLDMFYAEIVDANGSCRITIPKNLIDAANLKVGDKVKVWIKRIDENRYT